MMRRLLPALLLLAALAGCGERAAEDGKIHVVAAFYPLQFISERVGGDAVSVTNLTKAGAEPHDVELNPRQVAEISDAGLVVYLNGFQPAVDDAVKQDASDDRTYDVSTAVTLLKSTDSEEGTSTDPHVWLDPARLASIADELAVRLGQVDPEHAATYTANAATLHTELNALDAEYAGTLKTCVRHELVTSHTAFHYLADRYGLTQIGITGIDPEAEPSPRRLAEVAAEAKRTGTTTIFFETLVSPKVAETIAREVGAVTAVLDPLEGLTDTSADYFSVMRTNLSTLSTALECSS
ncbi:metal ABC transporter substrate-binding protein [Actinoplanes sp. NPDC051851]|uniref:metal ABC transporter substrate-binding protein n=1 Tax=Actinoplanes sp. NPDC051851 TaxID=3154753 RepID=UPI003448E533